MPKLSSQLYQFTNEKMHQVSKPIHDLQWCSAPLVNEFDGGGSFMKPLFVEAVRRTGRTFDRVFEWCAGMGEIGFALLDAGLCKSLCIADINPKALSLARPGATVYVSDNMKSIPEHERFDLVVANPPNYYNVQKSHPIGKLMYDDLRPNDRGWKIHKEFYRTIRRYLTPGALLLIHEVQPYDLEVYIDHGSPYDVREEVPINSFKEMIADGGLNYEDCFFLGGISYLVVSSNCK